jgi:hypothetical protein
VTFFRFFRRNGEKRKWTHSTTSSQFLNGGKDHAQPPTQAAAMRPSGKLEVKPGRLYRMEIHHDDWCALLKGEGECDCDPDIEQFEVSSVEEMMMHSQVWRQRRKARG